MPSSMLNKRTIPTAIASLAMLLLAIWLGPHERGIEARCPYCSATRSVRYWSRYKWRDRIIANDTSRWVEATAIGHKHRWDVLESYVSGGWLETGWAGGEVSSELPYSAIRMFDGSDSVEESLTRIRNHRDEMGDARGAEKLAIFHESLDQYYEDPLNLQSASDLVERCKLFNASFDIAGGE